jgi:nickel transport protein
LLPIRTRGGGVQGKEGHMKDPTDLRGNTAWHRRICPVLVAACLALTAAAPARAHFGIILPADDMVMATDGRRLSLQLMFLHPFQGSWMSMARPAAFGVRIQGQSVDLLSQVHPAERSGHAIWAADYDIRRPGDHVFFLEPAPYFEPAEECFIVHYTKVIVHALGMESGWDEPVGLKTEIVPLSRPYGLWTGNVFQGKVLRYGAALPNADVEVELLAEGTLTPPADPFITQVVRTDANGVFTYGLPRAGWWGFAALSTDEAPRRHSDGHDYPVEIGAVLWVRAYDME